MKKMSQESMFSDVQLEDPDGRRNSNAGPCVFLNFLKKILYTTFCVIVICLMALAPLYNEYRECGHIKPTDICFSC